MFLQAEPNFESLFTLAGDLNKRLSEEQLRLAVQKYFLTFNFRCHSNLQLLLWIYKRRVLVQNKLNLLLKMILYST